MSFEISTCYGPRSRTAPWRHRTLLCPNSRGIARDKHLRRDWRPFRWSEDVVATIAQPSRIVPVLSGFSEAPFVSRLERQLVSSCFGSALFRRNLELHSLPCLPTGTISDLRPSVLYALDAHRPRSSPHRRRRKGRRREQISVCDVRALREGIKKAFSAAASLVASASASS